MCGFIFRRLSIYRCTNFSWARKLAVLALILKQASWRTEIGGFNRRRASKWSLRQPTRSRLLTVERFRCPSKARSRFRSGAATSHQPVRRAQLAEQYERDYRPQQQLSCVASWCST